MILRTASSLPGRLSQGNGAIVNLSLCLSFLDISTSYGLSTAFWDQIACRACRSFSSTSPSSATLKKARPRRRDAYAVAQSKARLNANLSRQETLRAQRTAAQGDFIRGIPTPFVTSFDASPLTSIEASIETLPVPEDPANHMDHFFNPTELATSLSTSYDMTAPAPNPDRSLADPALEKLAAKKHAEQHSTASVAVSRILSLANASSKARTRANIQRCIDTFGRHNTDLTLRQKAPSAAQLASANSATPNLQLEATPRAGKDTGSSEVQIAILTAKIRILADAFQGHARGDKVNKRNLRLLLHRRQKLLRYMKKRERGSGRWEFMLKTLGLTEATWEGQIAVTDNGESVTGAS